MGPTGESQVLQQEMGSAVYGQTGGHLPGFLSPFTERQVYANPWLQ